MTLTIVQTSAPAVEPVTVAEAKAHLRVLHTEDDSYIETLITIARQHAEALTERQFITATWRLNLDEFPCTSEPIRLPRPNLIAVSSITYVDTDGTSQTLSSSLYQVDANSEPGRITPAYQEVWPTTRSQLNAIAITYTAGYGATATTVPSAIKHAIKILVAQWYEHREPVITGTMVSEMPLTVKALLGPYRIGSVY